MGEDLLKTIIEAATILLLCEKSKLLKKARRLLKKESPSNDVHTKNSDKFTSGVLVLIGIVALMLTLVAPFFAVLLGVIGVSWFVSAGPLQRNVFIVGVWLNILALMVGAEHSGVISLIRIGINEIGGM